jgi:hypothetical protein
MWWLNTFPATALWRSQQSLFMPPVVRLELPRSLIRRFLDATGHLDLAAALRFLSGLVGDGGIVTEHAF